MWQSLELQETKEISHLKGRVEKYHDLAKSMSNILNSFEQRLGKLEHTIVPVYKETEHLQKKQQSIFFSDFVRKRFSIDFHYRLQIWTQHYSV